MTTQQKPPIPATLMFERMAKVTIQGTLDAVRHRARAEAAAQNGGSTQPGALVASVDLAEVVAGAMWQMLATCAQLPEWTQTVYEAKVACRLLDFPDMTEEEIRTADRFLANAVLLNYPADRIIAHYPEGHPDGHTGN